MEIIQTTHFFSRRTSFAGHPRWHLEQGEIVATVSDQDHDFEIRIDVQDLRKLAATTGGLTIAHAIEKLIASN